MAKKKESKEKIESLELADVLEQEVQKPSPEEEYKKANKKSKNRRRLFVLFVLVQFIFCSVYYAELTYLDLPYRVKNEIQNTVFGTNTLSTGTYTGETDFGYFVGEGVFTFRTGTVYTGHWQDNEMHGKGTLKVLSEGVYEGEFSYSDKEGNGTFTWDDGTIYEGEWKDDQMEGQGVYTGSDGVVCEGTFGNNQLKDGTCTFTNETGAYVVEYKEYEIDSLNVTFADGSTYVGDCDGQIIAGSGTMAFFTGDAYTGSYEQGLRNGKGVYTWANGASYDGQWVNDLMSGSGIYTYSNGGKAQGTFDNNQFISGSYSITNNFGTYTFKIVNGVPTSVEMKLESGTTYSGDMVAGKLSGSAEITYSNGDQYSGKVTDGKKTGYGSYIWKNGAQYEGDWAADKMEGSGVYMYPTSSKGYKITGTFKNGAPDGECQYYTSSSESFKTDWSKGKCVKIYE